MKPIIFNTEMVKAILDGRKVCTRRPLKPQPINMPEGAYIDPYDKNEEHFTAWTQDDKMLLNCGGNIKNTAHWKPPYQKGDILYVRETWLNNHSWCIDDHGFIDSNEDMFFYKSNSDHLQLATERNQKWKPSIHMPKEYARLFLKVTNARVEELHDIENPHDQILKEGWPFKEGQMEPYYDFKNLWNSIYKNWDSNPWVWVIDFKVKEN